MRSRFLFRSFAFTVALAAGLPVASAEEVSVAAPVPETPAAAASAELPAPAFVFFQMADGRFFHPATGAVAASEAELRAIVGVPAGEPQPLDPEPEPVPVPQVDPLVAAIRRAQAELDARVAAAATSRRVVKDVPDWREITIAVWDRATDQIQYVDARKRGTELKFASDFADDIRLSYDNGLNSEMVVNGGDAKVVVALRYPAFIPMDAKGTLYSVEDVVYVPFSRFLQTSAMVHEGERYLDELVRGVFDRLRAERVASRAFPDRLLADVIDPAMVMSIAAIEHLDEASLQKDTDRALERFFVTIGANRGQAYNFSRSSAGALGLVQFIPSTYNRLSPRPEWGLEKDFEKAMRAHDNAMRAQVIYLDLLLTEFSDQVQAQFISDPERINEYIVAAYNGGSGRVRRAIETWQQVFNGERTRQLQNLRGQYETTFAQADALRKKTLAEKDKKKRAALQKQLDAKRVVYRSLQAQIDRLEASILRKETIGYVEKYRLTKADERFAHRGVVAVQAAVQGEAP